MGKTQKEILSEIQVLVRDIRSKAELLESLYSELENAFENESVGETVFDPLPEEGEPIDLDIPDAFDSVDGVVSGEAAEKEIPVPVPEAEETVKPAAVLDVMTDRQAWRRDMPGTEVSDVRSAISLNDRILFIKSLFASDASLFQTTLDRLNGMGSLDEAVAYLIDSFPAWNFESDTVYRFMMAVRRKLR